MRVEIILLSAAYFARLKTFADTSTAPWSSLWVLVPGFTSPGPHPHAEVWRVRTQE